MKTLRSFLAILFVLSLFESSYSQTNQEESYEFPGETSYQKGKIYLKNNTRFEVTNLKIVNDSLSYIQKNTSQMTESSLNDIEIIKVSERTHAGEYALYGGLFFGLSAVLGVAQANAEINSDPYKEHSGVNEGALIGGFTVAGVLIGGLVGSASPKWKTLYVNEQASLFNFPYKYALNLKTNENLLGLSLQFSY